MPSDKPHDVEGGTSSKIDNTSSTVLQLPRLTDSPGDPLNWTMRRKATIVLVLWLAAFSGFCSPLAGQLNLIQQAKLYHKTAVEMTS